MAEEGPLGNERLPVREARWDRSRSQAVLNAVHGRVRRTARLQRTAYVGLSVAACALACVALWQRPARETAEPRETPQSRVPGLEVPRTTQVSNPVRTLRFPNGTTVALADGGALLDVVTLTPERVEVALGQGQAAFRVPGHGESEFVVRVASVSVMVLASEFTVTREATRVHVQVREGRVRVLSAEGERALSHDEAAWFELTPPAPVVPEVVTTKRTPRAQPASDDRTRFLKHARDHEYREAMALLRERPSVVQNTPEDLMLAADAARLSGDPAAAVPYLERVALEHARDARAPLAAFTLGRILLSDLGRPADAQKAFARTRALSEHGSLAEDALAREVEAAAKAGHAEEARSLAATYLARYPQGRRRAEVLRVTSP